MNETPTREALLTALHDVDDPETGLDIVDLGLVYDVAFQPETGIVAVSMTLTTPACPAGGVITAAVARRLAQLPGVADVDIEVTFEPRWTPERISPAGRAFLGWT